MEPSIIRLLMALGFFRGQPQVTHEGQMPLRPLLGNQGFGVVYLTYPAVYRPKSSCAYR